MKIKKAVLDNTLDIWISEGIPCDYVKFQNPVAPASLKEPVYEFQIPQAGMRLSKYFVDKMWWTPHCLIFEAYGRTSAVSLANVAYARFVE